MAENTMFALRKLAAGPGLVAVGDAPVPPVGPTDVLIAVAYAGLCGTDRHIYEWDEWSAGRVTPPLTIGHEFSGTVVEVGSDVTTVAAGTRVSAEGHIGCRACRNCRTGNSHVCDRVEVIGIDRDGAFATYIAMPAGNVWPLADNVSTKVASVMDPLGNAMHTVMSADVSGKSVLVTGVGVIGLMAVAIARQNGAHRIIAVDLQRKNLERAATMGADDLIDAGDPDWAVQVLALTKGQGAEVWLEMSGAPPAISAGFQAIGNGATVAMLGLPKAAMSVDLANDIILRGTTVLGISGRRMFETWYQMERFLRREGNAAQIESLITHSFAAADFEQAFAANLSGEAIKVVMSFGGDS